MKKISFGLFGILTFLTLISCQAKVKEAEFLKEKLISELGFAKSEESFNDVTIFDLKDKEHSLNDLLTDKTILVFFATWCPWCQKELPAIDKFYQDSGENINIIAVALNDNKPKDGSETLYQDIEVYQQIKDFKKNLNISYDLYWTKEVNKKKAMTIYDVEAFPTVFIFDKENNIFLKKTGFSEWIETGVKLK